MMINPDSPQTVPFCDVEAHAWPPIKAGANAVLASLCHELDRSQWYSPEALAGLQARQLQVLVQHHAQHTPHFRARLSEAGLGPEDITTPATLTRLPLLTRRDIQAAGASLFALYVPKSHAPVNPSRTSGSTGEPVVVKRTGISQLFWSALTMREHLWLKRDFSQKMAVIRAHIDAPSQVNSWGTPVSQFFRTGPRLRIPILTPLSEQARMLAAYQPSVLLVYPNNLNGLADVWEDDGSVPKSLRHIWTISESVSPALRERIRRLTDLGIEDNYSSQELGTIAIQCPESGLYHINAESVLIEVLNQAGKPCAEGETGRVVATDLHNTATAIIRYEIGDHAEVGGACPCGRRLPTLRRIMGRSRNLVVHPDGRRHWPHVGQHLFRTVAPLRQYQFIQHALESIEFKVVCDVPLTEIEREGLLQIARENIGPEFAFDLVEYRERLPLQANGKFEDFISRVS
ncbi:MAG TPA: hypothetical protein DCL48_00230 [Alphaproteobacteria bacterium]|nr:hypothetical protein [Alphaproteobacteria bacterium]